MRSCSVKFLSNPLYCLPARDCPFRLKRFTRRFRVITLLLPALFIGASLPAQSSDFSELFGENWHKAISFLEDNDSWIRASLASHGIPYKEAIAVVFPELVRYSALRDKMEITMLKTLYRYLGDDYSDFSVGIFQVKPSFAERVRAEISVYSQDYFFRKKETYPGDLEFRSEIVNDLENPVSELKYIIAFLKICNDKFNGEWTDDISRIKFLAAAYNAGFWRSAEDIRKISEMKFYSTGPGKNSKYSYVEISLAWYNQQPRLIEDK